MSPRPDSELRLMQLLKRMSVEDLNQSGLGKSTPPDEPTEVLQEQGEHQKVPLAQPDKVPAQVTLKNLFSHRYSHPIALDLALLGKYGHEWLSWEAETVQLQITEDFGTISDLALSKLMAVKTLHMVDAFWERWEVFVWCVMPFNEVFPDFDMMQVPTVAQCAVAVDIANRIRMDVPWSTEMKTYLATVHKHDHLFVPVPPLDFVRVDMEGLPFDKQDVLNRWPACRGSGKAPPPNTLENVQLGRMLEVYGHVLESQERLRQQLPLVQHA